MTVLEEAQQWNPSNLLQEPDPAHSHLTQDREVIVMATALIYTPRFN